jgi:hypothetical protein
MESWFLASLLPFEAYLFQEWFHDFWVNSPILSSMTHPLVLLSLILLTLEIFCMTTFRVD